MSGNAASVQGHSLDPGQPLRNEALYMKPKSRKEESWKKFHHKHKQVFGQMFQLQEKEVKEDLPLKRPKSWKRGDADNLWKHLWRSRQLVSAVKQGSSYFQLLKEQEEKKNEKRRKKEERRLAGLHHPSSTFVSENAEDSSVHAEASSSRWRQSNKRWDQRLRPFTPVHQSLTSDQPQQLSEEHVYRQLCCLTWLLEALTLGHSGKFGPVASCWDARDPGRSRNIHKSVYREKLIQAKWDRLISPPKSMRPGIRLSHITSLTHKSSGLNTMSSSVLTTSVLSNMSSCDVTFSGEESECSSMVMSQPDPPFLNTCRCC
ncbi:coiled-coil domain-containing protein 60-like isoform X2 [Silurus meridionalis]|uniref:coiled-coil domain-containing protein 60-like isoform X2 n=1 Tax=Silurus meridionalis TaxID=175797 RepID=UPI001EEBEFFF|nr:coiled-coil domain-containing protein 60-like isoform X2 [Silurus meridionalis]